MRLFMLDAFHIRLMHVQIDCRHALEVITYCDNKDAVFYLDPPYHVDTRSKSHRRVYHHELDSSDRQKLVEVILKCQGVVVLSCYDHPVYQPLRDAGWEVLQFATAAHAAVRTRGSSLRGAGAALANVPRVETVYRNQLAVKLKPIDKWIRQRLAKHQKTSLPIKPLATCSE